MNIAFSINQTHLFFAFVTINSILTNNTSSFFNIYIIHDNSIITEDLNKYIQTLKNKGYFNFEIQLIDITKHPKFNLINHGLKHWGKEIFYKVLLSSLFPKLDHILSLDTDVVCCGNISNTYNTNLENYCFAGDMYKAGNINVGVLLHNLANIRKYNIENEWLTELKETQENEGFTLNYLFSNKVKALSDTYTTTYKNNMLGSSYDNAKIIHIIGFRKPWIMAPWRKYGAKTTLIWYKYTFPFIQPSKKIAFYLITFYGTFLARILYSLTKKTPLGKYIYKSSYSMLKKIII